MFSFRKKSDGVLREEMEPQASLPFSYPRVGATEGGEWPLGFYHDRIRYDLGAGGETYTRAKEALRGFRMYPSGWTVVSGPWPGFQAGAFFVTQAYHLGFWSANPCRIIQITDHSGEIERFGFSFGTLPSHAEMGEERFLVEWDRASDRVTFEIAAFSRPRHWLARLGWFFARRLQRRFQREAQAAMLAEVRR